MVGIRAAGRYPMEPGTLTSCLGRVARPSRASRFCDCPVLTAGEGRAFSFCLWLFPACGRESIRYGGVRDQVRGWASAFWHERLSHKPCPRRAGDRAPGTHPRFLTARVRTRRWDRFALDRSRTIVPEPVRVLLGPYGEVLRTSWPDVLPSAKLRASRMTEVGRRGRRRRWAESGGRRNDGNGG